MLIRLTVSFIILNLICGSSLFAQLTIDDGLTADEMVAYICGSGVTFSNATYTGADHASGMFQQIVDVNLGISQGIVMTSGDANTVPGPNSLNNTNSTSNNLPGDPDLDNLLSGNVISTDASVLEFDFIPSSDTIMLDYVFASEEYPDFVNSSYNDIFAFMVTGPNPNGGNYEKYNIALIPGSEQPVSINTVNEDTNPEYYRSNHNSAGEFPINVNYNGFTVVLTGVLHVVACEQYHIKFAIGDGSNPPPGLDYVYDSGVFLEGSSFTSPGVGIFPEYTTPADSNFAVEGCTQANVVFELPEPSEDTTWIVLDTIYGTAIMGVDYYGLPDSIMIPPGELSDTMVVNPIYDQDIEGIETMIFEYDNNPCTPDPEVYVIEMGDFVEVNLPDDTTACDGVPIVLDSGMDYIDFLWNTGDTTRTITVADTGIYYVTVNNYGCPSGDTTHVSHHPSPGSPTIYHD